jgi:hypothetical protein
MPTRDCGDLSRLALEADLDVDVSTDVKTAQSKVALYSPICCCMLGLGICSPLCFSYLPWVFGAHQLVYGQHGTGQSAPDPEGPQHHGYIHAFTFLRLLPVR